MLLRYDPARPSAPITVVHDGSVVERARLVDAFANCFVKRDRRTGAPSPDTAAATPPKGLAYAKLGVGGSTGTGTGTGVAGRDEER